MAPSDEVKGKDATKVHLAALKRGKALPYPKRLWFALQCQTDVLVPAADYICEPRLGEYVAILHSWYVVSQNPAFQRADKACAMPGCIRQHGSC